MKVFMNEKIKKKFAIAVICITIFMTIFAKPVRADDDGVGGKLLSPVLSLLMSIGDGAVDLVHKTIMGQEQSAIRIDMSSGLWDKLKTVLAAAAIGLTIIAAIVLTAGVAGAIAGAVGVSAATFSSAGLAAITGKAILVSIAGGIVGGYVYSKNMLPQDLVLPLYSISPEEIFKGQILFFDVDFFNPENEIYMTTKNDNSFKVSDYSEEELRKKAEDNEGVKFYYCEKGGTEGVYEPEEGDFVTSKQNSAFLIRKNVSKWYNALKNIALVLMMSVLLYIAIRMLLSTVASDKAKYKQMMVDWVVSICLLFFMHYIMAFSVTIVKSFNEILSSLNEYQNVSDTSDIEYPGEYVTIFELDDDNKISDKLKDVGLENLIDKDSNTVVWPSNNLMGQMRINAQMSYGDFSFIGYSICFLILVIYTVAFVFTYLKRVLYLAFLTIIAPFVALTYSIDKITDGQAQGFNKWLKEYIFNLLIQPLHLLLYTVLVTSALEFAKSNVIYSLVAIGFMLPAEQMLRSLFNFEKASTPGSLVGATTAATMLNQGLNVMLNRGKEGKSSKGGKGGGGSKSSSDDDSSSKIGFNNDFDALGFMAGGSGPLPGGPLPGGPGSGGPGSGGPGSGGPLPGGPGSGGPGSGGPGSGGPLPGGPGTSGKRRFGAGILGAGASWRPDAGKYRNVNKIANWAKPKVKTVRDGAKFVGSTVAGGAKVVGGMAAGVGGKVAGGAKVVGGKAVKGAKSVGGTAARAGNRLMPSGTRRRKVINGIATLGGATGEIALGAGKAALGAGGKVAKATAGNAIRFTKAAAPVLGKQLLKGAVEGISKAPEFAFKTATGAAVGLAAGTAGTIGAIASGDPKNLLTYGGGAALAGFAVGNNLGGNVIGKEPNEAIERNYYGDDYERIKAERAMKEWKISNKEALQRMVGNEEAKKMMKTEELDQYLKNDITDIKDIATMHELTRNNGGNIDKAIATQKYASRVGSAPSKMKAKDKDEWTRTFKEEYEANDRYRDQAEDLSKRTMDEIDRFYKIRSKL